MARKGHNLPQRAARLTARSVNVSTNRAVAEARADGVGAAVAELDGAVAIVAVAGVST